MTLKQYNTILESKTFTLKQYYMIWGKMQNFCFHFSPNELSWQITYNMILEKHNFYFKAILHDFGKKCKIFVLIFDIWLIDF